MTIMVKTTVSAATATALTAIMAKPIVSIAKAAGLTAIVKTMGLIRLTATIVHQTVSMAKLIALLATALGPKVMDRATMQTARATT